MQDETKVEKIDNELNMYLYPDFCYRETEPSLVYVSYLLFKQMFKYVFNGFKEENAKNFNSSKAEKVYMITYVLFVMVGFLSLAIALGLYINIGIMLPLFIFLGIGGSLFGIVTISLIISAVICKNYHHQLEKIYFYSNNKNEKYYTTESVEDIYREQYQSTVLKKYKPILISDISTKDLIIPKLQVKNKFVMEDEQTG